MVLRSLRAGSGGAEPTGLKRTTTLSWGKVVPTSDRAAAASRGRLVSTREAVMVRGRSGDWLRAGMSGLGAAGAGGEDVEGCGVEDMAGLMVFRVLFLVEGSYSSGRF